MTPQPAMKPEELSWTAALQLLAAARAALRAESERCLFWENTAKEAQTSSDYYQAQLTQSHALLGRVIHQLSERWDAVNLTPYFPTDNLNGARRIGNAGGAVTPPTLTPTPAPTRDPGGTP